MFDFNFYNLALTVPQCEATNPMLTNFMVLLVGYK